MSKAVFGISVVFEGAVSAVVTGVAAAIATVSAAGSLGCGVGDGATYGSAVGPRSDASNPAKRSPFAGSNDVASTAEARPYCALV